MAPSGFTLARPRTGIIVLGILAVVIVAVALAAYHGSSTTTASECGPSRAMLARTLRDATAARTALTTGGSVPDAAVAALVKDYDDVNNFINGAQHPDAAFDGVILPLADNLGRAVTDAQARPVAPSAATDFGALVNVATAAATYCHAGSA